MSSTTASLQRCVLPFFLACVPFFLAAGAGTVHGQSGTRLPSTSPSRRPAQQPSAQPANLALKGYCPVCIVEMGEWVKGAPQHQVAYDGKTYYFPSAEQKRMFLEDPAKYTPALRGDCVVCLADMGRRVPGSVFHTALYKKRLYLFPGEEQQQKFLADPAKYADVDLALDGSCSVCRVEMNKDVPGKPEIAAYYRGLRYLFPSEEQRRMFLANPDKYAVQADGGRTRQGADAAESTKAQTIAVRGKSGCAGCDHGVAPIKGPNELGLAVTSDKDEIYVVEEAHRLYPQVYEKRFEGLPLEVQGEVLKRDGKVVWLQPTSLRVVN